MRARSSVIVFMPLSMIVTLFFEKLTVFQINSHPTVSLLRYDELLQANLTRFASPAYLFMIHNENHKDLNEHQ